MKIATTPAHASRPRFRSIACLAAAVLASACHGSSGGSGVTPMAPGPATFTIGGTLSGLQPGQMLTLQNNGGDDLTLSNDGAFVFGTALADGSTYAVQVSVQPTGAACTLVNAAGTLASANVINVAVTCVSNMGGSGSLDVTFNPAGATPGIVVDPTPGIGISAGIASMLDASGRLLVTGNRTALDLDLAVWRFNTDGSLDTTFNAGGATPGVASYHDAAGGAGLDQGRAITLDASGRILVAGISRGPFNFDPVLWRFNTDGTLDTTFNALGPKPGLVVFPGGGGGNGSEGADAVLVDGNGKILVVGAGASAASNAFLDMVIWRFNADGTPDTTFNPLGSIPGAVSFNGSPMGLGNESANSVVLDASGRILVCGEHDNASGIGLAIWRYLASGDLDTSFNTAGTTPGVIRLNLSPDNFNTANDLILDSANRIVVVGRSGAGVNGDLVLLRFLQDGTLDSSFNPGGATPGVTFHDGAAGGSEDSGLVVREDAAGKLVVTGHSFNPSGDADMAVWRFLTDGSPDTSFNPGGAVPGAFTHHNAAGGGDNDFGSWLTIDALGRITIAGNSTDVVGGMAGTTVKLTLWRIVP